MNKDLSAKAIGVLGVEIKKQGLPSSFLNLAMLQLAHETGGFNSRVSRLNNLSGIKFSKNGFGYDSGVKPPPNEGNTSYAAYKSLNDWAKDYIRIVRKSGAQNAKTIQEFAAKLKAARYYGDTVERYTKGLLSWTGQLKDIVGEIPINTTNTTDTILILIIISSFLIYATS